jgi:hypothetical protein
MNQLSSNSTLFFKVFVPIFWLTFFGALAFVSIFAVDEPLFMGYRINNFRIGAVIFWLCGLTFFYFTSFKMKRVDADDEFIYVSNYFQNFRYPYHNIEKIKLTDFGVIDFASITLKQAGKFGKKIYFIRSTRGFKTYLEKHPELEEIVEKA